MLYWHMELEKNATWQAGCDYVHDRAEFECRSEIYGEALTKLQAAIACFGFNPERDVLTIRLRVHSPGDLKYDHEVLAVWSTIAYGDIHPLTLCMLNLGNSSTDKEADDGND